jgi:hypothetical protein
MEYSIMSRKLTDGSKFFSVVFVDGEMRARIECIDELSAIALRDALSDYSSYAEIESRAALAKARGE